MFEIETEWVCPDNFPNLRGYDIIAIDLETKDLNLKEKGSGSIVGDGNIVGIAVAVDGWSGYYPIAHEGGGNLDKKKVLEWIQEVCSTPSIKVFHNAMYDVCWLKSAGIKINGTIIDTMITTSLVDENRLWYTLNSVAFDKLKAVKSEKYLQAAADSWGIDAKSEMYKLPAMYVGDYAEKDAELTLRLYHVLKKEVEEQDLKDIFDLETKLFPCLIDMSFKGVRIDLEKAHKLKTELVKKEEDILYQIKKQTGKNIDIGEDLFAPRALGKFFDGLNIPYKRTEKTKAPSFTKKFFAESSNPIIKLLAKAREIRTAHSNFIEKQIINYVHKGRIHAHINPLRGEQGGTITGRFSYYKPNLQQIPARNKELGPLIRSLFLPEEGYKWGCFDYSQQEPRLVVHYAASTPNIKKDSSVKEIVDNYKNNDLDFHSAVAKMANIDRDTAKTINLGLFYGMGKNKLKAELELDNNEAEELFDKYHSNVPFVKMLSNQLTKTAQEYGYIKTLLGRRCRFPKWEVDEYRAGKMSNVYDSEQQAAEGYVKEYLEKYPEANKEKIEQLKKYPKIRRAYTYKAMNKLIQGSAADQTKQSMINLYKEGIIPHIQIHDELDISVKDDNEAKKIVKIMESSVELAVPSKVDYECGDSWGDIYS